MNNNFSALRLICASLVIVTHANELLNLGKDGLYSYSNQQVSFSHLAVNTFFVISGFLIFKSYQRSTSWMSFIKKRLLRIYPAFVVSLFFSLCIASVFYTGQTNFWLLRDTWQFISRNMGLLFLQHEIPGVFVHNPVHAINGSWWTIPYEVLCYVCVSILFILPCRKAWDKAIVLIVYGLLFAFNIYLNVYTHYIEQLGVIATMGTLSMYFVGGALMNFVFKDRTINNKYLLLILIICIIALPFKIWFAVFYIGWPIAIIGIGLGSYPIMNKVDIKLGDISYGIYLFAFPIQQMLVALKPTFNPYLLMITTFLIVIIIAKLSWEFVEKPFLKFKPNAPA